MISQIGRYQVIDELGRGAKGVVYKSKDPLIDRFLAIKVINLNNFNKSELEDNEDQLVLEAKAAGRLSHPNIVTIYDVGKSANMTYIAMELLEGQELGGLIADNHRLSIYEILDIAIQVSTGLAYAHQNGIIHCDIKPSNVMVLNDFRVKIVDFGISRFTSSMTHKEGSNIIGTPLYMSPEQMMGRTIDARSDIFSLGVLLYQMLTRHAPFAAENLNKIMSKILGEDPPRPSSVKSDVPDMMDSIVLKCLVKDPRHRYQNANELAEDLRSSRTKLLNAHDALDRLKRFTKSDNLPIHQVIYESIPTMETTIEELLNILKKSQYKNIRLDISGLLVFRNGKFLQLLEGEKKEVDQLFAMIQLDPRHKNVKVIMESDSHYRCMPSWVMGFSTDEKFEDEASTQSFYITPDVTRQICESLEGKVGSIFLKFIGNLPVNRG
jgi:serine/threonine protein kinase